MAAERSSNRPHRAALPRYAVVMAGGQGTRFWPRSRGRVPKQLLRITGRHTLLQDTVRRLVPLCSWQRILVVCSKEHAADVRRQLPRVPAEQILVEPIGRNTAPCIALAAEWIAERVGDAVMIVAPADHVIKDEAMLRETARSVASPDDGTMLAVLTTKAACNEAALRVTETALRVTGGAGFSKQVGIDRPYRDARAGFVMAPTSDALFDFAGRAHCGLDLF